MEDAQSYPCTLSPFNLIYYGPSNAFLHRGYATFVKPGKAAPVELDAMNKSAPTTPDLPRYSLAIANIYYNRLRAYFLRATFALSPNAAYLPEKALTVKDEGLSLSSSGC